MNSKTKSEIESRHVFQKFVVAGAAVLFLLLPLPTRGGGVVTNCTETDLRAAMAGGGTVTFACDGVITLAGTITNTADTALDATGHQITISGGNVVRIFRVQTNVNFAVKNLTLANGRSDLGAAIFNAGGTLIFVQAYFHGNTARSTLAGGGAIFNGGGTVNATNCNFQANAAETPAYSSATNAAQGGAIFNQLGQVILQGCEFAGNQAVGGHAFGVRRKDAFGGAIHSSGTLWVDTCTFRENSARGGDGDNGAYPITPGIVYPGGPGGDGGGGAICNAGPLVIRASTFESNWTIGGFGGNGGPANVESTENGGAGGAGGDGRGAALYDLGTAALVNCTMVSNTCTGGAGGLGGLPALNPDPHFPAGHTGPGGAGGSGLGVLYSNGALNLSHCIP